MTAIVGLPGESIVNTSPIQAEYYAMSLRVSGSPPPDVRGTLYRNGPNPQFSNLTRTGLSVTEWCTASHFNRPSAHTEKSP